MDTGKERKRIKAWEQKICFLHLRECMIPTENISLTHEHYDLCVLPRPRSQPCWYLHVEFPSNVGNKMVPPDWLAPPTYWAPSILVYLPNTYLGALLMLGYLPTYALITHYLFDEFWGRHKKGRVACESSLTR